MKNDFNHKKFIQYVHGQFSNSFSEEDIENLFELSESYEKDDPKSQGKILSINELIFSGIKSNQEVFSYQRKFQKGINTWIADNLKGKSTIFKIIKYCLTGNNTIKRAVKDWFKDFLLEFSLTNDIYTVHIDASAPRVKCALYKFTIEEFTKLKGEDKLNLINPNIIFTAASEKEFTEKIEDFFFNELSFYTLQYRHRPGLKNESVEANLSWQTYFKSIYLESSNYKYLYFEKENIGRQGTKILEMLLGLRLTYPINQLTLLKDMKDEKIRNTKFVLEENKKANKDDLGKLTKELQDIENKLTELSKQKDFQSIEGVLKKYGDLETSVANKRIERNNLQSAYNIADNQLSDLEKEISQFSDSIKVREGEIKRIDKDIIQKELFVEAGSFFTNLEVHECPHCEHPVSAEKKAEERSSHTCSLCGTNVTIKKSDDEQQKEHIAKLNAEKNEIQTNIESLKKQLEDRQNRLKNVKIVYDKARADLQKYPRIDEEEQKLNQLGSILRQQTEEQKQYQEALSKRES
ncbi:hypothetical protein LJC11_04680 [Bacteroidales bacterium OttesenSCG-928-I21]|nr:hypothetical protein [Bacteroidales bacterium OttesenSCG-928-I21]